MHPSHMCGATGCSWVGSSAEPEEGSSRIRLLVTNASLGTSVPTGMVHCLEGGGVEGCEPVLWSKEGSNPHPAVSTNSTNFPVVLLCFHFLVKNRKSDVA